MQVSKFAHLQAKVYSLAHVILSTMYTVLTMPHVMPPQVAWGGRWSAPSLPSARSAAKLVMRGPPQPFVCHSLSALVTHTQTYCPHSNVALYREVLLFPLRRCYVARRGPPRHPVPLGLLRLDTGAQLANDVAQQPIHGRKLFGAPEKTLAHTPRFGLYCGLCSQAPLYSPDDTII